MVCIPFTPFLSCLSGDFKFSAQCAEVFANDRVPADKIQVNVQPLSGAPSNNAAYHIINPGDTVLAMDLLHGGHLSHGSPANRTGQLYNIVHYTVDPETELIDYDELQRLALEHKPRMIICGYTSYPYIPDWKRYREIADSVGAYLLADIAHNSYEDTPRTKRRTDPLQGKIC